MYNEEIGAYVIELDDILFCFDEEPGLSEMRGIEILSKNYINNIDYLLDYVITELNGTYGVLSKEELKAKLGKPQIYPISEQIVYCDQEIDLQHIFSFEYKDENLKEFMYFSIDG